MQPRIDRDTVGSVRWLTPGPGLAAAAAGVLLVASMAGAADGKLAQAKGRYQQDRAGCASSQPYEDRAACMKEAGAVLNEAKRGIKGDDSSAYERNRLLRCDSLGDADRDDCLRRMRGEGTVSGSVESGGIYRELRTVVPAQ